MTLEQFLLIAILVALIVLIVVVLFRTETAFHRTLRRLGLAETIGAIQTHADEIKRSHKSLEQMLRVPTERASMGEVTLEGILADHLPADMYGIREKCIEGKVPDAHVKSPVGLICIDSKFPLDNYARMVETDDEKAKDHWRKHFLRDLQVHLAKVASDYVCPDRGSAEFAFAFIPSEAVYYFLVREAYDTLRGFTKRGVQVASPLTLSHKVELIRLGVVAMRLNETAQEVRRYLRELARRFDRINEAWNTLYTTHLRNLKGKADELNAAYDLLKQEFNKVSQDYRVEEKS